LVWAGALYCGVLIAFAGNGEVIGPLAKQHLRQKHRIHNVNIVSGSIQIL